MDKKLENIQAWLMKYIDPVAAAVGNNAIVSAVSHAMMRLMPVFIGSAIFSLIANFPIAAVTNFLASIGIQQLLNVFVNTQTNLMPVLYAFLIAYTYAGEKKCNSLICGIFSLLSYFILMPDTITVGDDVIGAYATSYLGSGSIFASIIISIIVSLIYCALETHHVTLKLPKSLPSFVADCFAPLPSSMIIIGLALVVSFICSFTSSGNFFTLILNYIQTPIVSVGTNPVFMVAFYTLVGLFWFFAIHPTALMSFYSPVLSVILSGNVRAMMSEQPLPYMPQACGYLAATLGGTGCLLGLGIVMVLFAKSERYKSIGRAGFVPMIFNVNEPVMFGAPVVMNSIFLIPMLVVPALSISIMLACGYAGLFPAYNAMMAVTSPWTMPSVITAFLTGGVPMMVVTILVILLGTVIYYPFFKIADKQALEEEKALAAAEAEEGN